MTEQRVPSRPRRTRPLQANRAALREAIVDVREGGVAIDLTMPPTAEQDGWVSPRRRILLVDDEPDVFGWIRYALEPLHWELNAARTASDGLEMATRLLPDVVLLDQQLPDGRGIEIGRWLRVNQPAMVLVMFSAYLDLATEEEAAQLGIATISKVDHKALLTTLEAVRADLNARRRANLSEI